MKTLYRKNNNRKIEGERGTMGRGKRRELSIFPLPIVSRALSFPFSPASLRHKEASVEGGVESSFKYVSHYFVSLVTEMWGKWVYVCLKVICYKIYGRAFSFEIVRSYSQRIVEF